MNSKLKYKGKNDINAKENTENKSEHKFSNEKEKRRIKKFNKNIDYEALKMNPYLPTSRSFGFFKYKENKLLKEENQIISCVPDIEKYDINKVEFILLISGLEINPEMQSMLTKEIKNLNKTENPQFTKNIEDILKSLQNEKIKSKDSKDISKSNNGKNHLNLFFGNEVSQEENMILRELDNDYYKDVLELNENQDMQENGNITYILIKINKEKNNLQEDNKITEKDKEENGNKLSEDKSGSLAIEKKEENKNNSDNSVTGMKEIEKKDEGKNNGNDDNNQYSKMV